MAFWLFLIFISDGHLALHCMDRDVKFGCDLFLFYSFQFIHNKNFLHFSGKLSMAS